MANTIPVFQFTVAEEDGPPPVSTDRGSHANSSNTTTTVMPEEGDLSIAVPVFPPSDESSGNSSAADRKDRVQKDRIAYTDSSEDVQSGEEGREGQEKTPRRRKSLMKSLNERIANVKKLGRNALSSATKKGRRGEPDGEPEEEEQPIENWGTPLGKMPLGRRKSTVMNAGSLGNGMAPLRRRGSTASFGGEGGEDLGSVFSLIRVPTNFGSQAHLFAGDGSGAGGKGQEGIAFRKKAVYLHLTVIFGLALVALAVYDYVMMNAYQTFTITQHWLVMIMILHVATLYINTLSFIYANEAGDVRKFKRNLVFLLLNVGSFVARVSFELAYVDYLPEIYVNRNVQ